MEQHRTKHTLLCLMLHLNEFDDAVWDAENDIEIQCSFAALTSLAEVSLLALLASG